MHFNAFSYDSNTRIYLDWLPVSTLPLHDGINFDNRRQKSSNEIIEHRAASFIADNQAQREPLTTIATS